LVSDRAIYSAVLTNLHKDSYAFDWELTGIEDDLDKTGKLLSTFEKMRALWERANRNLNRAIRDKKRAEMRQCGVWDDVKECVDRVSFLHEETSALLKTKVLLESKLSKQLDLIQFYKESLEAKRSFWEDAEKQATGLLYRRPGEPVITRYGYCYIRTYRSRDDMVMLSLPFGTPCARLWMVGKEIADGERGRQQAERIIMGIEDEATQTFFRTESINEKKERFKMQCEEEGYKVRIYEC
jgi:hypothetical protein